MVVGIAGFLAGSVVALMTRNDCSEDTRICIATYPYMIHGALIAGITGTAAIFMVMKDDEAHVE